MSLKPLHAWLALLTILATSCVPILPHVQYIPEMAEGKVLKNACWGTHNRVEYRTDGIVMTTGLMTWPDERLKLEVMIAIPEGITVELANPDIRVASPPSAVPVNLRIAGISTTGNPAMPMESLAPMVGSYLAIPGQRAARNFWLFSWLDGVTPGDMRIQLPPLKINQRLVKIPEIQFTRDVHVQFIAPLQC